MPLRRRAVPAPVALVFVAGLSAGCSSVESWNDNRVTVLEQSLGKAEAVANVGLVAPPGSRYGGRVSFSQYGMFVLVRADITGLQPNRDYGLHVHERGD